ncbi:MAG: sensor histidine kinase [Cyanobacteria bacterium J069]|nr:MAG: sensor histidine kinase [Cyanobacteria bacterium J069]
MPFRLLPAAHQKALPRGSTAATVPLMPNDPLAAEQFCLALTPTFGLVMVLGEDLEGTPALMLSFDPVVVRAAWQALRARLLFTGAGILGQIEPLVFKLMLLDPNSPSDRPTVLPDYRLVSRFSRLMLDFLPEPLEWEAHPHPMPAPSDRPKTAEETTEVVAVSPAHWLHNGEAIALGLQQASPANGSQPASKGRETADELLTAKGDCLDMELLQAIAHEVRTPLTTIRTLTRLLLKRKDLSPDVLKRLQIIDQECTEQIDRFNLIFRAAELETAPVKHPLMPLAPVSLAQVFEQNVSRWQQLASQRSLKLTVNLPQKLPNVVTDPNLFDQVLTGLIDRLTQTLPPGSEIRLQVELAGHQLKLQFESEPQSMAGVANGANLGFVPPLKSLGQLLMFQPETGSLSLSLAVTKNLFQALGGKLIVKERPQRGQVLTVFLPLESR